MRTRLLTITTTLLVALLIVAVGARGQIYIPSLSSVGQVSVASVQYVLSGGDSLSVTCSADELNITQPHALAVDLDCIAYPTPTPLPTPTPEPTATPEALTIAYAPVDAGEIHPDIPPLPADWHDDTQWHPLAMRVFVNGVDQGIYRANHTHNDNPALADHIFGSIEDVWGQTVSYPWLTPDENDAMGHPGYKYAVEIKDNAPVPQEGYSWMNPQPHYVTAWRVQYHDAGGNHHFVKRFHSYYLEARILSRDGAHTGYIRTGGVADFGILHVPYKQHIVPLPGIDPDPITQSIHGDPYRALHTEYEAGRMGERGRDNRSIWTSHPRYGWNQRAWFFFRVLDTWGGMDPDDPHKQHLICPDFQCKYNNSEHHVFSVHVDVPAHLADENGLVNYTGWTDVKGNIDESCTETSATCVPIEIVNAPTGTAIWSRNTSGPRPEGEEIREHDLSPPGHFWIEFPN